MHTEGKVAEAKDDAMVRFQHWCHELSNDALKNAIEGLEHDKRRIPHRQEKIEFARRVLADRTGKEEMVLKFTKGEKVKKGKAEVEKGTTKLPAVQASLDDTTPAKVSERRTTPRIPPLSFDALQERIKARKDTTIEDLINTMLLKGGTRKDILEKIQTESKKRNLKIYTQGASQFNYTLKFREKKGWIIKEDGDHIQLIGLQEVKK